MSDDEPGILRKIFSWFNTPGSYGSEWEEERFEERDDIWAEEHLLDSGWQEIQNKVEWYESPQVITIYEEHKYIFNTNMEIEKPHEKFYYQNVGSDDFESIMIVTEDLPSGLGELKLKTDISTQTPPSGDNEFANVEYFVTLEVRYNRLPSGITFLPRILAHPLNGFFKRLYENNILEEEVEYDLEYARERMMEYYDYIRKYHGEEPVQTKTTREEYEPGNEGPFFQ